MRAGLLAIALLTLIGCSATPPSRLKSIVLKEAPPNPDANWPWPGVELETTHNGVQHWYLTGKDGSNLDLLRFDFKANPNLRFEIYDQDEDDEVPFDDRAAFGERGVARIVDHLENKGRGKVIAACNGLFFAFDKKDRSIGSHIGPVVLRGKARYNVGRHRWMFGAKSDGKGQWFGAHFKPETMNLEALFDYGADGAQKLLEEGIEMSLQPVGATIEDELIRPTESEADAGYIPAVDHIRTSRTSLGWAGERYFYLLVVDEPDNELESSLAFKRGQDPGAGWTLADLQRFWKSLGVWEAVNVDGGMLTQLLFRRPDGRYELVSSQASGVRGRRILKRSELAQGPKGGSLMTFYIRDLAGSQILTPSSSKTRSKSPSE